MDGRVIDTQIEYQFDVGIAHKIFSPKLFVAAHQIAGRSTAPSKANFTPSFDNPNVRKHQVETEGSRCSPDSNFFD